MPSWLIAVIVIAVVVLLVLVFVIGTYNSMVKLKNNVEEGYSTMDVFMKKRYDVIPNIVESVKGYAKHEEKTLEGVMQARYSCMNASTPEEKAKGENMLAGTLKTLFAVSENYPQLKANENFLSLQNTLKDLEDEIANSRKYYNGCVKQFNNKIEVFPSNIIARWFKFTKKVLFEVSSQEERVAPKVQF